MDAVRQRLRTLGVRVFYDACEKINLWGKGLPETFVDVFQKKAKLAIALISAHYVRKLWQDTKAAAHWPAHWLSTKLTSFPSA